MTIQFTVYDASTGEIKRTGNAMTEASARSQAGPGERVTLIGSDPKTEVISVTPIGIDGTNLPRQPMKNGAGNLTTVNKTSIAANGVDKIVISNVPNGAKYDVFLPANLGLVQPPDGIVTDGVLELTTTVKGIYSVKLSYLTFLDFTVTFDAN